MHSLLDAFQGDYSQQAAHYQQRMRQLQQSLQSQLVLRPEAADIKSRLDEQLGDFQR